MNDVPIQVPLCGRSTLFVALGKAAGEALHHVFDDLRPLSAARGFPYQFGFGLAETGGAFGGPSDTAQYRVAYRPLTGPDWPNADEGLYRLWQRGEPQYKLPLQSTDDIEGLAREILKAADEIANARRVGLDRKQGIELAPGPAEIVLVIENDKTSDLPWWSWGWRLADTLRQRRHRVLGIVLSRLPVASAASDEWTAVEDVCRDVQGRAPFTQFYFVANRDQRGQVHPLPLLARLISTFLVDRMRPEGEELHAVLDRHEWVDRKDQSTRHVWSLTHKTFSFDPEEVLARLKKRHLWNALGKVAPRSKGQQASRPAPSTDGPSDTLSAAVDEAVRVETASSSKSRLWGIIEALTTPHPESRLATQGLPESSLPEDRQWHQRSQQIWKRSQHNGHPIWPPIGQRELADQVADYEASVWSQVSQSVRNGGLEEPAVQSVLPEAHHEVLCASHRLHVDAIRMTRFVRDAELGEPDVQRPEPRVMRTVEPAVRWPWYVTAGVLAFLGGAAFVYGLWQSDQDVRNLLLGAGGVGAVLALVAAMCGALARDKVTTRTEPPPPAPKPPPVPFDLALIETARVQLAELSVRLSQAMHDAQSFRREFEEMYKDVHTEAPVADALHEMVTDAEIDRLQHCIPQKAEAQFREAAGGFPERLAEALRRGEGSVEVVQGLDSAFCDQYRFLFNWDVDRFMRETRGETLKQWQEQWSSSLATAWDVQDEQCEDYCGVTVELGPRDTEPPASGSLLRSVRVYKLSRGALTGLTPATSQVSELTTR